MNARRSSCRIHAGGRALATALVLATAVAAGAQDVPVEKYRLPNGMTVLLHVDRRLPVAAVSIWYHVGTRDDPPRRSGFAHLFEHLMFMGTERVPQGEFDRLLETSGGGSSATTGCDHTRYFTWGPAPLLPRLLWLEAERLEDMPRAMDQAKLDLQRNVVLNEMRDRRDNRPYGRAPLAIQRLLYRRTIRMPACPGWPRTSRPPRSRR